MVNKESKTESIPGASIPAPEGVTISIPKVWLHSLTGSDWNSLTDPAVDEPTIEISQETIEEYGAGGDDKINFTVKAELENLGCAANVSIGMAWDPEKYPTAPLVYQSDLKSDDVVEQAYRMDYLPKYTYMRKPGVHELVIMAQLREIDTKWQYKNDDYTSFTEKTIIGDRAVRKIKVVITK